jgi:hypothetical protein
MNNLPPGVTQKIIDDHFSGPCDDCLDDNHRDCKDTECRCSDCDEIAMEDAAEVRFEEQRERRLFGDDA